MAHNGNGFITSNGGFTDDDNKPMLLMKKSIDSQGNGFTALINKQLQGRVQVTHHDRFNRCLAFASSLE
jgi:hypothetical protein